MTSVLEPYKKGGGYEDAGGCYYDDAESFIQCGQLGFCGCLRPEANLALIRSGLRHIASNSEDFVAWENAGILIFGNKASLGFFYYWCDKEKITEHGFSLPGWLSEKGKALLAALEEVLGDDK